MAVYAPRAKIAIASSFEGIVNNGATECALTSFNAYRQMGKSGSRSIAPYGFDEVVEAEDFSKVRNSPEVKAFLLLRPLVEVAEDYYTVMEAMNTVPGDVTSMFNSPGDEASYAPLIAWFNRLKGDGEERAAFKKAFYDERERMKKRDLTAWMNTQEPYEDSIAQFRSLVDTQERVEGAANAYEAVKSGFVPWFATSKDEASTYLLCKIYTSTKKLDPATVAENGTQACVISLDRLVGKETVPSRNKAEQLAIIAEREGIPRLQVWRLNDRYDPEQQVELRDEGFPIQPLVPGYMFPHDIRKAREDPNVMLLERDGFAAQLGEFAAKRGY